MTLNWIVRIGLVYVDYVNILGGRLDPMKKNTNGYLIVIKEVGKEVNIDEAKCIVMPRDQDWGRNHSLKLNNIYFEREEVWKIQERIKRSLKSGNAYYHSVQDVLS